MFILDNNQQGGQHDHDHKMPQEGSTEEINPSRQDKDEEGMKENQKMDQQEQQQ